MQDVRWKRAWNCILVSTVWCCVSNLFPQMSCSGIQNNMNPAEYTERETKQYLMILLPRLSFHICFTLRVKESMYILVGWICSKRQWTNTEVAHQNVHGLFAYHSTFMNEAIMMATIVSVYATTNISKDT